MQTDTTSLPKLMPQQYSFVGQRADKLTVEGVVGPDDVDEGEWLVDGKVMKKVSHYTVQCPDCGGDGYYDEKGQIVCEDCPVVISGNEQPAIPVDYTNSRGFTGKRDDQSDGDHPQGVTEPSI